MINHVTQLTNAVPAPVTAWLNIPADDVGQAKACSQFADKSMHVFGSFDGATVSLEGSHDGVNWAPLTDLQGNTLQSTVPDRIKQTTEISQFIRPVVTGGGGATDITVLVLMKE